MHQFSTEECHQAAKKAMKLLEFSDRTTKQLEDKLRQSGFSENAITEAVNYVKSFHYIDDERYAVQYILNKAGSKSRVMINQELKIRGLTAESIQSAWAEAMEQSDMDVHENEWNQIRAIVDKSQISGREVSIREIRRVYGKLVRKGFSYQDIQKVMEEYHILINYDL